MRDFTASGGSIRRALVAPDAGDSVARRHILLALKINQQNCSATEVPLSQFRQLAETPPGFFVAAAVRQLPVKSSGSQAQRKVPVSSNFSECLRPEVKHLIWQT